MKKKPGCKMCYMTGADKTVKYKPACGRHFLYCFCLLLSLLAASAASQLWGNVCIADISPQLISSFFFSLSTFRPKHCFMSPAVKLQSLVTYLCKLKVCLMPRLSCTVYERPGKGRLRPLKKRANYFHKTMKRNWSIECFMRINLNKWLLLLLEFN